MRKKLLKPFLTYIETLKKHTEDRLLKLKYSFVLKSFQLLADLITNASIVVGILLVIFLASITLSFSLSVVFGSHVQGFLGATLCLTLAALLVLWKRNSVETYFAGLTIARYFEKRYEGEKENSKKKDSDKHERRH